MTTRCGSGVPSAVAARPGDAYRQAVDLTEIRRTGMVVDLLASRRPAAPARRGSPGAARDRL